ncbi:anaerobic ribonucleoside-triphosphate reductase activating protein [Escherichia coli]|uniref:Anaerobic ribonucleoside-triphosphate reductase activating protein n=1 Tax=Escherichia coli TaxID=562 RepID=A0A377DZQ6_ECOLX|nr:anaerobic ribonucleoside-triphosphate reductase activating protein [Escherichia coli]
MNYHQYYPVDIVNGPGTRCTLFVSGVFMNAPVAITKAHGG